MAFFEAMQAIFALDLGFFIDVFMNNLFWVFAFAVMLHYFFDGKNLVYWFVFWSFLVWAILDWQDLTGIVFTAGGFPFLYYLSKLALLGFAESVPGLRKYMVVISTVTAYTLMLLYTFFLK